MAKMESRSPGPTGRVRITLSERWTADGNNLGGATAGENSHISVRSDYSYGLDQGRVERELPVIVLQQNGSLLLGLLRDGRIRGCINRRDGRGIVEQSRFIHRSQYAMNHIVEAGLRYLTGVYGLREELEEGVVRLFLVEPGQRSCGRAVRRPPIRHDEAREPPVAFKNVIQKMLVLTGIRAIHEIVGAHYRLHVGVFDADFESQQVTLARAAFIYYRR